MQNGYANDSLHEPSYHKRPPHHPFEPGTNGCVANSYGVFALPFPIGYPGMLAPYAKGAMGFREVDTRFQHTPYFMAGVHLTLAALQLPGSGTPVIEGRPGTPGTRDSIMAFIRALEGRATKEDKLLLSHVTPGKGIRHDLMFDQAIAETIHAIVSGAFNDTIPGRDDMRNGRGERGGNDDLQDGFDYDIGDDEEERYGRGRGRGGGRGRGRYGGRDEEAEEEEEGGENETDLRIRELLEEMLEGHEGENVMEKVTALARSLKRFLY